MIINGYDIRPGADLAGANLAGADLTETNLDGANLSDANLDAADLDAADLRGANLTGADLTGADIRGADLAGADLAGADLTGADLIGADLRGAILPDGRTLAEYLAWLPDGLLTQGGKPLNAVLAAFGNHTWTSCPMATAFDVHSLVEVPECHRAAAALFIALFDGGHLDSLAPGAR